ncbi:marine proteobacterial sortase target protein [Rhizobium sp. NRK18]|uniref:marine proteobacterial sortase target protein n=1 Tax=Rhizobium sp. NRK18 TaxID=2964667 RepID=UPI0021C42798|nr:marine proteobacterial sortase target protein [Rhizobium sp. NRK18]MCQ2003635.1 marine proteobacterial sortase target protein [Rhizobium sp. NRK18]
MSFEREDHELREQQRTTAAAFRLAFFALAACMVMLTGLVSGLKAQDTAAKPPAPQKIALVRPSDMMSGALLFPARDPGFYVEAPKLATDVKIDVSGPIARVKVTQQFVNPSKGWVEGTYVFPLPENAAVDTLKMKIGDRYIEGEIKPRQEAREIYEQAKKEGKKAALLEQQRPNLFTNQVANIGPGEMVAVQIEYQQEVHQSNGEFSLRFPMVVAPRYNPQPLVQTVDFDNSGSGYATGSDPVPDREKITAPVLDPRENAKINPVTLTVHLDAGFPLGEVKTPFHEMDTVKDENGSETLALKNGSVPADRDFEIDWRAAAGKAPNAGLFKESVDGKTYVMAFVTPPADPAAEKAVDKREVVFILDNSGSMSGPSIEQAQASLALAISRLKASDRFNVIRFDDTMTDFFGGLVPASPDNREKAIAYVRSLTADGGTEMLQALHAALTTQGKHEDGALRQVVFLTDGAIGNEAELFDEIARNRGDARVFTVGIGSAPNSFFMTKAAELGRGTYTHIGSEDQVAERMGELFQKLEHPAMTDISAKFEGVGAQEITPDPMPDLYAGEPVVLTAELQEADPSGTLLIAGKTGDQPWRVDMDIAKAAKGSGIAKLWAKRKIEDLESNAFRIGDQKALDKQIEDVAMAHHLVSRVTSLVAVNVTASRPSGEWLAETRLPLNLPAGWDYDKVFGSDRPQDNTVPGQQPDKAEIDAPAAKRVQLASMTANQMLAAPSAESAALIASNQTASVDLPQTATLADRNILLGLLMVAFAVMAGICLTIWRRGFKHLASLGGTRLD